MSESKLNFVFDISYMFSLSLSRIVATFPFSFCLQTPYNGTEEGGGVGARKEELSRQDSTKAKESVAIPNGSVLTLDPPPQRHLTSQQIATELVHDIVNQAVTGWFAFVFS